MNGANTLLAQTRPNATTAVLAWNSPPVQQGRGLNAEITLIVVCNTTGSAANFSIFHDDGGGSVFDQTTALYYAKSLAANDTLFLSIPSANSGVAIKAGGQIGVQTSVANALTFSLYGITQQVPTR